MLQTEYLLTLTLYSIRFIPFWVELLEQQDKNRMNRNIAVKAGLFVRLAEAKGFDIVELDVRQSCVFSIYCTIFCVLDCHNIGEKCAHCGAQIQIGYVYCDPYIDQLPYHRIRIDLLNRMYLDFADKKWKQLPPYPDLQISQIKVLKYFSKTKQFQAHNQQQKQLLKNYQMYGLMPKRNIQLSYLYEKQIFLIKKAIKTNDQMHGLIEVEKNGEKQLFFVRGNQNLEKLRVDLSEKRHKLIKNILGYCYQYPIVVIISIEQDGDDGQRMIANVLEINGQYNLFVTKEITIGEKMMESIQIKIEYEQLHISGTYVDTKENGCLKIDNLLGFVSSVTQQDREVKGLKKMKNRWQIDKKYEDRVCIVGNNGFAKQIDANALGLSSDCKLYLF